MATTVDSILNSHLVKEMTKEALESVRKRIILNMNLNQRNASGRSVASLRTEVNSVGGSLYGLSSFLYMEKGRGKGRVPRGFADIIAQWIVDKGIQITPPPRSHNPDPAHILRSVSWCIATKIAQSGTALHRKGVMQDIFSEVAIDEAINLAEKIQLRLGSGVNYLNVELSKIK